MLCECNKGHARYNHLAYWKGQCFQIYKVISISHWNSLEKWTLSYKIHKVGNCDLIWLWVRANPSFCPLDSSWAYSLSISNSTDLCHQSLQIEGRVWDNRSLHKLSLTLQLKHWAKTLTYMYVAYLNISEFSWWVLPSFWLECPPASQYAAPDSDHKPKVGKIKSDNSFSNNKTSNPT